MVSLAAVYLTAQAPVVHNHDNTNPKAASIVAARTTFSDVNGRSLGQATLTDTSAGVLIKLNLQNVPPGPHAFHVHAVAKCEGPDFTSAGGHFNPTAAKHGLFAASGPHAGDLPNLFVPADGALSAELLIPNVTLAAGAKSLFDADGSALMLHAAADDHASDPAGNAGARIACGVVTKQAGIG